MREQFVADVLRRKCKRDAFMISRIGYLPRCHHHVREELAEFSLHEIMLRGLDKPEVLLLLVIYTIVYAVI